MAFTDERILEICHRYGTLNKVVADDGTKTYTPSLDKTKIKVYHATTSELPKGYLEKSSLIDNDVDYWGTVLGDKTEVVFSDEPSLIDAQNKFTEITE